MNAVFLGTPPVAVPFLQGLHDGGHRIPLVITNPDKPAGRSGTDRPTPVKVRAEALGLPVYQPRSPRRPAFLQRLQDARPDVLVVVAYGKILPPAVLEAAEHGAVNVHFSLLPKYRGAAPVQWALVRGETVTGVTTMRLSEGMDEGDILQQEELPVRLGEHAPSLFSRLVEQGVPLLQSTLAGLADGAIVPRPQDPEQATYAPLIRREDGEPEPDRTARELEGMVRGFDPWPGVWLSRSGSRLRLRQVAALPEDRHDQAPGTVLGLRDEAALLACGQGTVLAVRRLQPEGKREMSGRDAVNGRRLSAGDVLQAAGTGA